MFKFLFKKEQSIQKLIFEYLDTMKLCQDSFLKALQTCLLNGTLCENFDFFIKQTHKFESKADDINDEINNLMYGKALIPDSRGDIMTLIEAMDAIPDLFERILYMVQTQRLTVPEFLVEDIRDLVRISLECCDLLARQATALLKKTEGIRSLLNTIDTNESHCDHIERRIITKIFESDIDPLQKLQIKDLIVEIGDISDEAEKVSRRINIISMKRRV